ncbi:MAG: hypothetical protein KDK78_02035 [Chlamydiia bacterium]|nr:hypothetical protein [Chlamydiia bacterium]
MNRPIEGGFYRLNENKIGAEHYCFNDPARLVRQLAMTYAEGASREEVEKIVDSIRGITPREKEHVRVSLEWHMTALDNMDSHHSIKSRLFSGRKKLIKHLKTFHPYDAFKEAYREALAPGRVTHEDVARLAYQELTRQGREELRGWIEHNIEIGNGADDVLVMLDLADEVEDRGQTFEQFTKSHANKGRPAAQVIRYEEDSRLAAKQARLEAEQYFQVQDALKEAGIEVKLPGSDPGIDWREFGDWWVNTVPVDQRLDALVVFSELAGSLDFCQAAGGNEKKGPVKVYEVVSAVAIDDALGVEDKSVEDKAASRMAFLDRVADIRLCEQLSAEWKDDFGFDQRADDLIRNPTEGSFKDLLHDMAAPIGEDDSIHNIEYRAQHRFPSVYDKIKSYVSQQALVLAFTDNGVRPGKGSLSALKEASRRASREVRAKLSNRLATLKNVGWDAQMERPSDLDRLRSYAATRSVKEALSHTGALTFRFDTLTADGMRAAVEKASSNLVGIADALSVLANNPGFPPLETGENPITALQLRDRAIERLVERSFKSLRVERREDESLVGWLTRLMNDEDLPLEKRMELFTDVFTLEHRQLWFRGAAQEELQAYAGGIVQLKTGMNPQQAVEFLQDRSLATEEKRRVLNAVGAHLLDAVMEEDKRTIEGFLREIYLGPLFVPNINEMDVDDLLVIRAKMLAVATEVGRSAAAVYRNDLTNYITALDKLIAVRELGLQVEDFELGNPNSMQIPLGQLRKVDVQWIRKQLVADGKTELLPGLYQALQQKEIELITERSWNDLMNCDDAMKVQYLAGLVTDGLRDLYFEKAFEGDISRIGALADHMAILDEEMIGWLADKGADLDRLNADGESPLVAAVWLLPASEGQLRKLIRAGANIYLSGQQENRLELASFLFQEGLVSGTRIIEDALQSKEQALEEGLLAFVEDLNQYRKVVVRIGPVPNSQQVVERAIVIGNPRGVQVLLRHGNVSYSLKVHELLQQVSGLWKDVERARKAGRLGDVLQQIEAPFAYNEQIHVRWTPIPWEALAPRPPAWAESGSRDHLFAARIFATLTSELPESPDSESVLRTLVEYEDMHAQDFQTYAFSLLLESEDLHEHVRTLGRLLLQQWVTPEEVRVAYREAMELWKDRPEDFQDLLADLEEEF